MPAALAASSCDLGRRADEDRRDQALLAGLDGAGQGRVPRTGCATAVGTGSRLRHRSSSASYLPVPVLAVPVACVMVPFLAARPCAGRSVKSKARAPDTGAPPRGKRRFQRLLRRRAGGAAGAPPAAWRSPGIPERVPRVREPSMAAETRRPRDQVGSGFPCGILAVAADGRAIGGLVRVVVAAEAAVRRQCPRLSG